MKISSTLLLPLVLLAAACSKSNPGTTPVVTNTGGAPAVTTFAGTGAAGAVDGTKTTAAFNTPTGIAIASSGFMFIADKQNEVIRMVSPQGVVNTIAGTGSKTGFSNTAGSVTFSSPAGVAVDANGNVFVADEGNSAIRKIDLNGVVTTFAGSGAASFLNGTGTAATFNGPEGVAVDAAGNVYVADAGNNAIRKITTLGVVTTFAGTGTRGRADGETATFNQPSGVAVDASGNVYVADQGNNLIRKITPAGIVSTVAGSGTAGAVNGKGILASFNQPTGLTVDASGNIYVADTGNSVIRRISATGSVNTEAGTGVQGATDGLLTSATFSGPTGIVIDSYGRLFVVDTGNSDIRLITL